MSLARHTRLLGAALLIAGIFIGYGVSQALDSVTPDYARAIGCVTAGVLIIAIDIGLRRAWAERGGWAQYVLPGYGPRLGFLPAWVLGVGFMLVAFAVVGS